MRVTVRLGGTVVLCLLASAVLHAGTWMGAHAAMPVAGPALRSFAPGTAQLYRVSADGATLRAFTMSTLADRPRLERRTGLGASTAQNATAIPTADGSRFLVFDQLPSRSWPTSGRDFTIQLFDSTTGRPLTAIRHPAVPLGVMAISADGAVGYGIRINTVNVVCGSTTFYEIATSTGRVIRHFGIGSESWPVLVEPRLRYLYMLSTPDAVSGCTPRTTQHPTLTVYGLQSGTALHSTQLHSVLTGRWYTGQTVNQSPVIAQWDPGFALSPDGSQLALLDGHSNRLTLLAAPSLRIEGSESIFQPNTGLDALTSALGLTPDAAEAKGQSEGASLQLQYTLDGRSLLVSGTQFRPDALLPVGRATDLGIRRIVIATGEIQAWLRDGGRIVGVWPAPDGRAVYSEGQSWTRGTGWLATIRRHNPATLRVQASRTFTHTSWLSLVFLKGR